MYQGKRIIAIICARGGSKGVPGKNIKELLGKPLIAYTLEQIRQAPEVDRLIVSTENITIRDIAIQYGAEVPALRPESLATDTTPTDAVLVHALGQAEAHYCEIYDIVMTCDVSNPLRTPQDITHALDTLINIPGTKAVLSVVESAKNPYYNMLEVNPNGFATVSKKLNKPITRRQDAPVVYAANAGMYAIWKEVLLTEKTFLTNRTKIFIMPPETAFDIDRPLDFELVTFLMQKRLKEKS